MRTMILKISGSITIGMGDTKLQHQIQHTLDQGYDSLILDMKQVNYMDSSGVGALAMCLATAQERGAQLALAGLRPKTKQLLQVMCFLNMFQIYDSVEDALQIMRNRTGQPVKDQIQSQEHSLV